MTDREKYLFDLQGFVLIENVLSDDECAMAIEKITARMKPFENDSSGTWYDARNLVNAGEPFINLIDHPATTLILKDIIGRNLRLESSYSFIRKKGCPPLGMHGGGGGVNFRYHVSNNKISTGLCVISYALQDIGPESGGFSCIPGSHKSNFAIPPDSHKELYAFGGPLVENVTSPKGSAVIFTEKLVHGASKWQEDVPRYGLFYKYNDRAAIYHDQRSLIPSEEALEMMTDEQKCYFNTAWEAFGPVGQAGNNVPDQHYSE